MKRKNKVHKGDILIDCFILFFITFLVFCFYGFVLWIKFCYGTYF